jgi:hypothetical protein
VGVGAGVGVAVGVAVDEAMGAGVTVGVGLVSVFLSHPNVPMISKDMNTEINTMDSFFTVPPQGIKKGANLTHLRQVNLRGLTQKCQSIHPIGNSHFLASPKIQLVLAECLSFL